MVKQRLSVEAELSVIKNQLHEAESLAQGMRLLAAYRVKLGCTAEELAQAYGVNLRAIYNWIDAYNAEGLDGLKDKPCGNEHSDSDQKQQTTTADAAAVKHEYETDEWAVASAIACIESKLDEKQTKETLKTLIYDTPRKYGFADDEWTVQSIIAFVDNFAGTNAAENKKRKTSSKKNLDEEQRERLKTAVADTPRKCGYDAEFWTVALITDYIERTFGLSYIKPQVCHIMRSLGLPVRRAKLVYQKAIDIQHKEKKNLKSILDEEQTAKLKSAIANAPRECGYEAENWTIFLLIAYMKREFNLSCGKNRVSKLIHDMGVSIRRKKGVFVETGEKSIISRENLDENQRKILKEALANAPGNCGYKVNEWNVSLVKDYIEHTFGRKYIKPQVCHLLRSMGLSVRRKPNSPSETGVSKAKNIADNM